MGTSIPTKKPSRYWPLWIPRGLLLAFVIGPFLYTVIDYTFIKELSPRFWDFGLSVVPMITMAILLLIAWFKPIIGGILIIIASIILLFLGFSFVGASEGGYAAAMLMMWGVPLAMPGVLFVIFGGIRRSKKKYE